MGRAVRHSRITCVQCHPSISVGGPARFKSYSSVTSLSSRKLVILWLTYFALEQPLQVVSHELMLLVRYDRVPKIIRYDQLHSTQDSSPLEAFHITRRYMHVDEWPTRMHVSRIQPDGKPDVWFNEKSKTLLLLVIGYAIG